MTEENFRKELFAHSPFLTENMRVQIAKLREATAADHAAVEDSMSLLSCDLTRSEYVNTLQQLYGFVGTWECYAEEAAPAAAQSFIRARSRRTLLAADITYLTGIPPTSSLAPLPSLNTVAELLGALYVMEGSRLGGQFISKHIKQHFDLPDDRGSSYFRGFGENTGSMWKEVVARLESDIAADQEAFAIKAAQAIFRSFGAWMRREPSPTDSTQPVALRGAVHG